MSAGGSHLHSLGTSRYPVGVTQDSWSPAGPNRVLQGDNLPALRAFPDESFTLCYMDPPFNTGRTQTRRTTSARGSSGGTSGGFGGKRYDVTLEKLMSYDDSFGDYWSFLSPRLEEAWRVLKPEGTLYVHLDWREVHYAKVALDLIFGRDHFL
ncbi:MAG: site-specific DNA-methyltransferase (adenine-specific), partial [Pontimonas sp.]